MNIILYSLFFQFLFSCNAKKETLETQDDFRLKNPSFEKVLFSNIETQIQEKNFIPNQYNYFIDEEIIDDEQEQKSLQKRFDEFQKELKNQNDLGASLPENFEDYKLLFYELYSFKVDYSGEYPDYKQVMWEMREYRLIEYQEKTFNNENYLMTKKGAYKSVSWDIGEKYFYATLELSYIGPVYVNYYFVKK